MPQGSSMGSTFVIICLFFAVLSPQDALSSSAMLQDPQFGNDDHTVLIKRFLNHPADTLIIPPRHGGWRTAPIKWTMNDKTLILLPGTIWRALPGAFPGKGDCLLTLELSERVTILGYGARLCMRKEDYRDGEWRHTVSLRGVTDVRIEGLTIDSSGGDGIYVAGRGPAKFSSRVFIRSCRLRGHRRQGISVISAQGLRIEDCILEGTQGTSPEAGIDFEPNKAEQRLVDCRVRNIVSRGNRGPAGMVYLRPLNSTSMPVSIDFTDCLFTGSNVGTSFSLMEFPLDSGTGEVRFQRCLFKDSSGPLLLVRNKGAVSTRLEFTECEFSADGSRRLWLVQPVISILRNRDLVGSSAGGNLRLRSCLARARDARLVAFELGKWKELSKVQLELFVEGNVSMPPSIPGINLERLQHTPSWPPPPPMLEIIQAENRVWKMVATTWSGDSIEMHADGMRYKRKSGARTDIPTSGVLTAVTIKGNLMSDTLHWQVPDYLGIVSNSLMKTNSE